MNIKTLLRNVTPPIFWKLKNNGKKPIKKNNARKVYKTYKQALENCLTASGYEDNEIVKVVFEKTKAFRDKLNEEASVLINATEVFSLLPFFRFTKNKDLVVIDLGGACGAHYFYNKKIIPYSGMLNWYVVETPEMCRYGKLLENNELKFRDNLSETLKEIEKLNLLFTSGTIQCVEDPYGFLQLIINSGAEYILFNRLGLTEGVNDVITTHTSMLSDNGIGPLPAEFVDKKVEYPFSFIRKKEFDKIVESRYEYKIIWKDQTGIFPVNDEPLIGMGILCKMRKM